MTIQQIIDLLRATRAADEAGAIANIDAVRLSLRSELGDLTRDDLFDAAVRLWEVEPSFSVRYGLSRRESIARLVRWATLKSHARAAIEV